MPDEIYAALSQGVTAPPPAPPAPAEPEIDTSDPTTHAQTILWAASETGRGTRAGNELLAMRRKQADLVGRQTAKEQAARTGMALTPALMEAHQVAARREHGLPTPEEESQQALVDYEVAQGVDPVRHGARGFGLTALGGFLQLGRGLTAEEQDALAMAQQVQAAQHDTFTPSEKVLSGATEMVGNVASVAAPVGAPVRAAMLGTTMAVPGTEQGIQAGMDPALAAIRGGGQAVLMDALGGMKVPGLVSAPLTRKVVKQGGRKLLGAVATGTAQDIAAGATKGALVDASTQIADRAMGAIDPNTPQPQDNMLPGAVSFGAMDAVMGALTRGGKGATIGQALRRERNIAQNRLAGHQPNPEVAQMWANQPANAAALPMRRAGEVAAVQQAQARAQQAGSRPAADQAELLRMQEEPEAASPAPLTEQDAIASALAVRRQKDAALTQDARLRVQKGDEARDARLGAAAELLRQEQVYNQGREIDADVEAAARRAEPPVEADAGDTGAAAEAATRSQAGIEARKRQLEARYAARPEEEPVPGATLDAWRNDPAAKQAVEHFQRVMSDPTADRTTKAMARQGLMDAVTSAREREAAARESRPAVDELPVEPTPSYPGEPVAERATKPRLTPPEPEAVHRQEIIRIRDELAAGRMTREEAIAASNKARETLATAKEPTNARPSAVPEEVASRRQEAQGQDESRSPEESLAPRGDEVPEPPVDARSERTAAQAFGSLPDKTISPEMSAAGATNAARIDAEQAPETAGAKRRIFSPRTAGRAAQQVLARFRHAFGAFQGNKAKALPMMSEVTQRTMSPEARQKITHTEDLFAGSGSAGLMHRLINFPSAGKHVIREWNEARLEKVRMVQSMSPEQVRRRARELGVERDVKAAIQAGSSGGGMTGRLEKMISDMLDPNTGKVRDPAAKEYAALLQLYVDHIGRIGTETRKKQGKIYTSDELWSKLVQGVTEYSKDAYALAQAAKAKGIDIEYKQGDSFAADIPKGDNVHVLMDPPYFGTSGYNADDVVGVGTYRRVRDLFAKLRANGNHGQYTDEAWWTRKLPSKAEWKDGTNVREGDKILGQIHDEADTFDTHRVGERVESIATIDPTKPRAARAEPPAPVAENTVGGTVAEPTPPTTDTVQGTVAQPTPPPGRPATESAQARAVRAGLEGKSTTGERLGVPAAPGRPKGAAPALGGLKVTERPDGTIDVETEAGHLVAPVRIQPAMSVKNVDPRAWFRSVSQEHDIGAALRQMKLDPKLAKNADTFAAGVPREVQEKLFRKFRVRGGYDRSSGDIVLHVQGEAEDVIGRSGNHEVEHALVDRFMPKADKDALLQAMRDRKIPGADAMSTDPKAPGYAEFLEAVRHLNERWSPERDIAAAARQKMLADSGVRGIINRLWTKLRSFFSIVDRAAAKAPDGVEVVLGRLRKGEYQKPVSAPQGEGAAYDTEAAPRLTAPEDGSLHPEDLQRRWEKATGQPRRRTASWAKMQEDARVVDEREGKANYNAEREQEPEVYGRVQKVAGLEHERAQALADEVIRKGNMDAERQSLDAAIEEGHRIVADRYRGNAVEAATDILRTPGMRTVEQNAIIKMAMDEAAARAGWSTTSAEFIVKGAIDLYHNLHNAAKIMSHARNTRGPTGSLADLRQAVFAPSDATMERVKALQEKLAKPDLDASVRADLQQQLDGITAKVARSRQRLVNTLKEKYGIDLAAAEAENYAVDPQLAADVMSIIRHEMKSLGPSKFINFYRAALLSDVITTQGQQAGGNLAAAVFTRNPFAFAIREGSLASGKLAAMGWTSPKLYAAAIKNGMDSFMGRGTREREAGEKMGAPRNVHVQEALDVELGRVDDPNDRTRDAHKGLIMSPLTAISFRPMAFIDGAAQRFASGLHEADLYYKAVKESGGTDAEAMKMAKGVLDGTVEVPHQIRVEAIIKSLDATFQDLAIADPKKPGSKTDAREMVSRGMGIVRFLDHVIPVPQRVTDAETGKRKWAMESDEGERAFLPLGSLKIPFVRTGVAIARAAIRSVPSTAIPYMALRAGLGRYKGAEGKGEFRKDAAYLVMGGLVKAAVTGGVLSGAIQVTGTEDDDTRRKMMREGDLATGEYTLKALGYEIPFQRVEPMASMVAAFGNAVNRYKKGEGVVGSIKGEYNALLNMGAAMSWFHTLNDIRTMWDQSKYAGPQPSTYDRFVQQLAAEPMSSMWPAFMRTFKTDTARRMFPDAEGIASDPKKFAEYVLQKAGIHATPPMYNMEGKAQEQAEPGMLGRVERGALGRRPKDVSSPFTLAFDKFRSALPEQDREAFKVPSFNDTFTWNGKHYQMTPEEFSEFQRVAGEAQGKGFAPLGDSLGRLQPTAPVAKKVQARIDDIHRRAVEQAQKKILVNRSKAGTLNRTGDY